MSNNFQLSIMSKWIAKHISTKVSFKTTIRKRHVYIEFGWPWIWNQCFYLGIWNDDCSKMIVLPSFQLATRLNSKNKNETVFINELWHIYFFMNIGNSNCIIEVSTSRKCCFWHYFSTLHYYWPPNTLKSLVHTSWGKWNDVKTFFSAQQNAKKENQLKHKNQVRNRLFFDS